MLACRIGHSCIRTAWNDWTLFGPETPTEDMYIFQYLDNVLIAIRM